LGEEESAQNPVGSRACLRQPSNGTDICHCGAHRVTILDQVSSVNVWYGKAVGTTRSAIKLPRAVVRRNKRSALRRNRGALRRFISNTLADLAVDTWPAFRGGRRNALRLGSPQQ